MSDDRSIFIGGLPGDVRSDDIEAIWGKHGQIRNVYMKRGYAFVEFSDSRDASHAVSETKGMALSGSTLTINLTRSKPRNAEGGGGRDWERNRPRQDSGCFQCGSEQHWVRDCPRQARRCVCWG
eukprot:NODE_3767_length_524_cov_103.865263_g3202_i0.p2 GENE.NODE_3767_length_524_cov_103.865263_g3202_i0~~NODE_3767_length_524_cov_103.865263_g3202_i0.p2  ORF type:complete len:143 (+),score=34.82 NODE_3767_length_524_cov_103.865263_g3202_i0:58-429(+)